MINRTPNSLRGLALTLIAATAFAACGTTDPPVPGTISGTVTIEGVAAAGITVDLAGTTTGSAMTDGSGGFSFADVEPGTYTVSISGADTELVTFDMSSASVELGSAGAETVSFVGTSTGVQRVMVYAYYGIDGSKPNVSPAEGVTVDIYPTAFDRDAGSNRLARADTDAMGAAQLQFNRSDDTDSGGGATDNTVYTRINGVVGNQRVETDGSQEVSYQAHEVIKMAADTADVINADVTVHYRVQTIQTTYTGPEGSALLKPEWTSHTYTDTAGSQIDNSTTGFDGVASFDLFADLDDLPVTVFMRLEDMQPSDAWNIWTQTPEPTPASASTGRFMTYVHDGTQPPGMVDLGVQRVEYVTQAVFVPIHHEVDNAEATPTHTPGSDDYADAGSIRVEILATDTSTVPLYMRNAPSNGQVFWNGPNDPAMGNRANLNAQTVYFARAISEASKISIVTTSTLQIGEAGGGSVGTFGPGAGGFRHSARVCPLAADTAIANCSAFAYKYNNTNVRGTIMDGGSPAVGMTVEIFKCTPPDTATCTRDGGAEQTTTTDSSGDYVFNGLLEGIYEVDPAGSVSPSGGSPVVVTSGDADIQTKNFN